MRKVFQAVILNASAETTLNFYPEISRCLTELFVRHNKNLKNSIEFEKRLLLIRSRFNSIVLTKYSVNVS